MEINDNYSKNLEKVISRLNLRVIQKKIDQLLHYPGYPGINCLADFLDEIKVENVTIQLNNVETQLPKVKLPAIAFCKEAWTEYYVIIEKYENNKITYYDTHKGLVTEAVAKFQKKWNGITIIIGENEQSGEINYEEKRKEEKLQNFESKIVFAVAFLLSIGGLGLGLDNLSSSFFSGFFFPLLWLTLTLGSAVSIMLIISSFGLKNDFISSVCQLENNQNKDDDKSGCEAVMNSEAAKIFGWLSWSEVGLFYFLGSVFILLFSFFSNFQETIYSYLFFINLMALPFVVFSFYYQFVVLKRWCTLCVISQIFLLIEFSLFLFADFKIGMLPTVNYEALLLMGLIESVIIGVWFIIKQLYIAKQSIFDLEKKLLKIERDYPLFANYLKIQPRISTEEMEGDIILGNRNASNSLILISNPFCKPCREEHPQIMALADYYGEDLKIIIRFIKDTEEGREVIKHLLSISKSPNIAVALTDWYKKRDYEEWAKKYPAEMSAIIDTIYDNHLKWSRTNNIPYTPAYFLNGYQLNKPYNIDQANFFIRPFLEDKRFELSRQNTLIS